MSKVIPITSTSHFKQTTASSTYTVVDFYADWCGPCKVISPIFEQLAAQESRPGRLTFCKVNVDTQRDVAGIYGISAMPTFLILHGTKPTETIRGANPTALRAAILSAAASAARSPAKTPTTSSSASFSGSGKTLGSATTPPSSAQAGRSSGGSSLAGGLSNWRQVFSAPAAFAANGTGVVAWVVRFVGLYVTTLCSFEPGRAAEESGFAVKRKGRADGL